jgi:hypothetical protein
VAVATALLLVLASPGSAAANWRSSLNSSLNNVAEWLGLKQAKPGSLEGAIIALKSLTVPVNGAELVAAGSQEGHWTFVNKRGEKFTAASADELNRVVATLTPEIAAASGAVARLTLLLTEASVFEHRARLKDLPKGADLRLVVDGSVLPLRVRGDLSRTDQAAALYAEIRPNLLVAVVNRVQFDEAVWQLNRPLKHPGAGAGARRPADDHQCAEARCRDAAAAGRPAGPAAGGGWH